MVSRSQIRIRTVPESEVQGQWWALARVVRTVSSERLADLAQVRQLPMLVRSRRQVMWGYQVKTALLAALAKGEAEGEERRGRPAAVVRAEAVVEPAAAEAMGDLAAKPEGPASLS